MNQTEMAAETVLLLRRQYPDAECTLDFKEPWQLLVAAILAAQCTDARVNQVTPGLFGRFPKLADLASADLGEVENLIRSCGLYHNKARAILSASKHLATKHQGLMPAALEELLAVPGVGRKIANLILGDCFSIPAIVVDTHCGRISGLIGLTDQTSPLAIEKDLARVLPEKDWIDYGHLMVSHGRVLCVARRPDCKACPLNFFCRHAAGQGRLS